MNPIDWGGSPIAVSLIRGIIGAIIAGALAYIAALQTGLPEDQARLVGIAAGLAPLGTLVAFGASDQNRANNNVVIAGDVPEAAPNVRVTGGK
jgi:hypothetical protein